MQFKAASSRCTFSLITRTLREERFYKLVGSEKHGVAAIEHMLLWVYIYSAYVECNLGQFAYFTSIFFFCLREQFKRKEEKKKSTSEWSQISLCRTLRFSNPVFQARRWVDGNLQEVIIRGDALTSLAASALTIQPHRSILLHCHSLSVTGVCHRGLSDSVL